MRQNTPNKPILLFCYSKKSFTIMKERDFKSFCYSFTYIFTEVFFNMANKESEFQSKLIKKLKILFPGCYVLKNDANYIQGIPDLTILWKDKWATLECKRSANAPHRPNQDWYVAKMNEMSFSAFIFPENEREVLHELQQAFRPAEGSTRVSRRQQIQLAQLQRGQTDSDIFSSASSPEGDRVA